jgi:hypothetical protein
VPEGSWGITMTFGDGTCSPAAATYEINFTVGVAAGYYTFTAGTGLSGDTVNGTIACDALTCAFTFSDTGPVASDEYANVDSQTISALLIQDTADNIMGNGTVELELTSATSCTQSFTAQGNVAR